MKLADPLPIKFPRHVKKWLMAKARTREDRSVSAFVREAIERLYKREAPRNEGRAT